MFGNNTASTWGQPQQNQQQQQGTSAFGQPNAFGTGGGAFGTGAFGQNQQQQQQPPATNQMFGASTSTNTTGTGFGAFGAGSTSTFGGAKPATGFGAFGTSATSAFGATNPSTNAFGATTQPSTSTFGATPAASTSTFGGAGLFGAKPATTSNAFGTPTTATSNPTDASVAPPPVTTGSSNPPYVAFAEKDQTAAGTVTLHYQSISCMPAYKGTSFEELRLQDYAQGRKTAGQFGQSSTFGLSAPQQTQPSTSTFGSTGTTGTTFGAFGQPAQPPQPTGFGAFGQPQNQASTFGTNTGTPSAFGSFGQQNQQPQQQTSAFGAFGQPNQQQPQQQQQGTGLFGGGTGAFGQSKPFGTFGTTGTTSAFGTFGQTNQQQQPATGTTNLFGQPNQQQPQTGTSNFGTGTNTFGTGNSLFKPATTPAFGTQPATNAFSAFGQNQQNQPQQPAQGTNLFGQPVASTNMFGQNTQQQQQQAPQQSTGLFGATQPATQQGTSNLFGGGSTLFGNNQQKPAAGFGSNLFGANTANAANTAPVPAQSNIFGQPLGQTQPATTGTGFGGIGNGSSLFSKPATNSIFGQPSGQQPTSTLGSSLFNNTANASTLGTSTLGLGSSTLGSTVANGQAPLTASVAQPVSTNIPIFSLLPNSTGPLSSVAEPVPKRASSYFVDIPTRSPVVGLTGSRNAGVNKLRGFGASTHGLSSSMFGSSVNKGFSASTLTLTSSQNMTKGGLDARGLLGPQSFLGGNNEGRQSPKKLILDKKIDPSEVFGKAIAGGKGSKVVFNPAMSFAAREKEAQSLGSSKSGSGVPSSPTKSHAHLGSSEKAAPKSKDSAGKANELKEGDYWLKPSLEELRNMSNSELSSFKGLTVGRVGYGEIQFLEPVDLTSLPRLSALLGKVVQIDNKECTVYPDSIEGDDVKPQPGEGLNVKSRIMLLGCWPVDKATREPIKSEDHPSFAKHLKRLKAIKRTRFESYSIGDGKWAFTVDHF